MLLLIILQVNLTLATVIFYRRETSFADIVFLAGLVITYHSESVFGTSRKDRMTFSGCIKSISEPNGMRFLPIILLSTCVPLILSPLMMSLWMQTVSGNANFPFFQGLIFWVFFAFTIIEFANQTVREIESN